MGSHRFGFKSFIDGGQLRERDIFVQGNWWFRHTRGFDGMRQEGGALSCPIQNTENAYGATVFLLIKGDDLLLLVLRPTRHGYQDGEPYKHDFEEEV